jgi:hypothetical protein
MSEPSLAEAQADGYELARELFWDTHNREPTEEELQEEYEALCEKYRD